MGSIALLFILGFDMKNKKNIYQTIKHIKIFFISICFCCFLAYPVVDLVFSISAKKQTDQVKKIVSIPKLKINKLDKFPSQFDEFFSADFPLQEKLVSLNSFFKIKILGVSPDPEKVIVGKRNWLFTGGDLLETFRGANLLDAKELDVLKENIISRANWAEARNCKYYLAVVPDKQTIYSEFMPDWALKVNSLTMLDQLKELFKNNQVVHFIDMRESLLAAKKDYLLYYKIDHHWNDIGGYVGYLDIINAIRKDFPLLTPPLSINDFSIDSTKELIGGEAEILNIGKWYKEHRMELRFKAEERGLDSAKAGYPPPENFAFPGDYEIVKVVKNSKLPKAVIIRDSFTDFMLKYLKEHFRKSVFVFDDWQYKSNYEILQKEKPEIVITILYESNIKKLLKPE